MYDIKIINEGKERFKDLYTKSLEDRQKLRQTEGYRLCLLDLNELIAASVVYSHGIKAFFEVVLKMIKGEIEIKKNVDDK